MPENDSNQAPAPPQEEINNNPQKNNSHNNTAQQVSREEEMISSIFRDIISHVPVHPNSAMETDQEREQTGELRVLLPNEYLFTSLLVWLYGRNLPFRYGTTPPGQCHATLCLVCGPSKHVKSSHRLRKARERSGLSVVPGAWPK